MTDESVIERAVLEDRERGKVLSDVTGAIFEDAVDRIEAAGLGDVAGLVFLNLLARYVVCFIKPGQQGMVVEKLRKNLRPAVRHIRGVLTRQPRGNA